MSDQILRYMTETLTEQLNSENPAEARSVVQRIVKRAEIKNGRLVVHHQSPLTEVSSDLHVYEEVARMEFESMFLP